jgi:WD40 repeat protein
MSIRIADLVRRLARWGAGPLLLPLGLFTAVLFFATGRPVARGFLSANNLGINTDWKGYSPSKKEGEFFLGVSPSGRCMISIKSIDDERDQDRDSAHGVRITVWETSSMRVISSFVDKIDRDSGFEISLDRRYFVMVSGSELRVRDLESGNAENVSLERAWGSRPRAPSENITFAPIRSELFIYSNRRALRFDWVEKRTLSDLRMPENREIYHCFVASQTRPMAIVDSETRELWNIETGKLECKLDWWKEVMPNLSFGMISSGSRSPVIVYELGSSLVARSIQDGSFVRSFAVPADGLRPVNFSPDGRFLICDYVQTHTFVRAAASLHEALENRLRRVFPNQSRLALLDVRTGTIWSNLHGDRMQAFTDDGGRLISFTDQGRYEYDVPPRWQYFTPWAWAALGAWLGLATVWWKLRKRGRA